eukprot:scaffold153796_cov41-Prasinocladus_malaysianus.AAC.1
MGSQGMGKEGANMEETLLWKFWREWGGNKYCRAMINGAPTRPSGGRNYVYRDPSMMEERVLTLRRLLVPNEADVTMDMLEHIMRIPIKPPHAWLLIIAGASCSFPVAFGDGQAACGAEICGQGKRGLAGYSRARCTLAGAR